MVPFKVHALIMEGSCTGS